MSSEMVGILHTEYLRLQSKADPALGKSGTKARSKDVVDGYTG